MRIQLGCELAFELPYPTPIILMLNVHYSRSADLERPDLITTEPPVPIEGFRDGFGNWCSRVLAPPGRFSVKVDSVIRDHGQWDAVDEAAAQHAVEDLPTDTLGFLLASRYCESDALSDEAWRLFGGSPPGWARVKAIVDFVHHHIVFNYQDASSLRTAAQAYAERRGVCRDYAHLAIAFCRAMNIPTRYCTGYISDIGLEPPTRRAISQPGSKSISVAAGTSSIRATTRRARAACSWRSAAMPPTSRSPTRSARAG